MRYELSEKIGQLKVETEEVKIPGNWNNPKTRKFENEIVYRWE